MTDALNYLTCLKSGVPCVPRVPTIEKPCHINVLAGTRKCKSRDTAKIGCPTSNRIVSRLRASIHAGYRALGTPGHLGHRVNGKGGLPI